MNDISNVHLYLVLLVKLYKPRFENEQRVYPRLIVKQEQGLSENECLNLLRAKNLK